MTRRWWPFALVALLLIFLIASFIAPVMLMLSRAVIDRDLERAWSESAAALRAWDGDGLPPDELARTVAHETLATHRAGTLNRVANRLNYDMVGSRSLLYATADRLAAGAPGDTVADLARIDPRWGQPAIWSVMRHADGPLTSYYLLAALDRRLDTEGRIVGVPREQAVFGDIFLRTFKISAVVALLCTLLGYPVIEAEDMPDVAANSLSVAFGNFRAGYLIADRGETRILRDPFSNKPFVHFYATKRVGGAIIDSNAIKLLKFAAS